MSQSDNSWSFFCRDYCSAGEILNVILNHTFVYKTKCKTWHDGSRQLTTLQVIHEKYSPLQISALLLVLTDVNKIKSSPRRVATHVHRPMHWHFLLHQTGTQELHVLLPAFILLMITEGQPRSDPRPTITQIKTTLITTRTFTGCINLQ